MATHTIRSGVVDVRSELASVLPEVFDIYGTWDVNSIEMSRNTKCESTEFVVYDDDYFVLKDS